MSKLKEVDRSLDYIFKDMRKKPFIEKRVSFKVKLKNLLNNLNKKEN